jgi:hypothetical protein
MADQANAARAYTAADIVARVIATVPPPSAFVPELVNARLPKVIPEDRLKQIPARDHLVDLPLSGSLSEVLEGPIPHKTWLVSLRLELEKAKGSRHVTAIRHPTNFNLILPLWALPVWDSIAVASQERMLWVLATDWLKPSSHRMEDLIDVERARSLMGRIPWGMMAWALSGWDAKSRVGFLAKYLSFSWLGERNIDLMGICANAIAARDNYKSRGYMAPVYLGSQLQVISTWDEQRISSNADLAGWKAMTVEKRLRYIHIPMNLADSHWVVFGIDTESRTYCWGLSLLPTCADSPRSFLGRIQVIQCLGTPTPHP